MQKTKIAAEELAEMIRDGLAEEGHDVQVRPRDKSGSYRDRPSPILRSGDVTGRLATALPYAGEVSTAGAAPALASICVRPSVQPRVHLHSVELSKVVPGAVAAIGCSARFKLKPRPKVG
jgi:hypothetical protein